METFKVVIYYFTFIFTSDFTRRRGPHLASVHRQTRCSYDMRIGFSENMLIVHSIIQEYKVDEKNTKSP